MKGFNRIILMITDLQASRTGVGLRCSDFMMHPDIEHVSLLRLRCLKKHLIHNNLCCKLSSASDGGTIDLKNRILWNNECRFAFVLFLRSLGRICRCGRRMLLFTSCNHRAQILPGNVGNKRLLCINWYFTQPNMTQLLPSLRTNQIKYSKWVSLEIQFPISLMSPNAVPLDSPDIFEEVFI